MTLWESCGSSPEGRPGPVHRVLGDHPELGAVLQVLAQAHGIPMLPEHVVKLVGVYACELLGGLGPMLEAVVGVGLLGESHLHIVLLQGTRADQLTIVHHLHSLQA